MSKVDVDANDVINILTQKIAQLERELAVQIAINRKGKNAER